MAGKTPKEAVDKFKGSLQRTFSCITKVVLDNRGQNQPSDPSGEPYGITLGTGLPVNLGKGTELSIEVRQHYRVVPNPDPHGPWQVQTAAYYYTLKESEGPEILSYHWHPEQRGGTLSPHLHLKAGARVGRPELTKAYVPTGRVMAEDFVQLLIEHFGVRPLKKNWRKALATSRAEFEEDKSWGGRER